MRIRGGHDKKNVIHNRRKKYGISPVEYAVLYQLHQGMCAICKRLPIGRDLHLDHDHQSGKIRGLLCRNCNIALGLLKEDEDIIWNMLEYIKKFSAKVA